MAPSFKASDSLFNDYPLQAGTNPITHQMHRTMAKIDEIYQEIISNLENIHNVSFEESKKIHEENKSLIRNHAREMVEKYQYDIDHDGKYANKDVSYWLSSHGLQEGGEK
jgi:hypothetical protein